MFSQGSALTGSLHSALSKGQHIFAFPQKQSRDQITATFQFIWLLPRETQLSSCFWANSAFSLPLQTGGKSSESFTSREDFFSFIPLLSTQRNSQLAFSFHSHWVIFQTLKILRHRRNWEGGFRICGSRCNSAAQLPPASIEQIHSQPQEVKQISGTQTLQFPWDTELVLWCVLWKGFLL